MPANEYGRPVSVHVCQTCGHTFTVCPPADGPRTDCTGDDCPSYDPSLDASIYFLPDDPALIEP
jgi:hypothetical protein